MTNSASIDAWNEINAHVDRFERAWMGVLEAPERSGFSETALPLPEIRHFLPSQGHPLYLPILHELIRVDLEFRWKHGERQPLEEYLRGFPESSNDEAIVRELAFEEYRLRSQSGENPSLAEYEERFGVDTDSWPRSFSRGPVGPLTEQEMQSLVSENELPVSPMPEPVSRVASEPSDWHGPQTKLVDVLNSLRRERSHLVTAVEEGISQMPEVGSMFLDFLLVAELGRGAIGHVYLARQRALADRFVALKVSVHLHGEDQLLAQLQHTNIVPIYSTHHSKELQAVCMPYFGATTLADVSKAVNRQGSVPTSGDFFAETITSRNNSLFVSGPHRMSPVEDGANFRGDLERLSGSSYVEALILLGEQIAEGLAHSHERGILHRDLKPGNILLTDEGRAMLLDFNLSEDTKLSTGVVLTRMGGTLPYMSPEQLKAFVDAESVVDERADIYSLGVMLWELFAGKYPFPTPGKPTRESLALMLAERKATPPRIRTHNPAVSPALEAIVRKCIDPKPEKRYQSANDLREDLERQRTNRWLKHTREPSLSEAIRKWLRRHPSLVSPLTLTSCAIAAVALVAILIIGQLLQQSQTEGRAKDQTIAETKQEKAEAEAKAKALLAYQRFEKFAARTEHLEAKLLLRELLTEETMRDLPDPDRETAEVTRALKLFRVLDDPNWTKASPAKDLSEDRRRTLKEHVGRLLRGLARAHAWDLDKARRRLQVSAALSWLPGSLVWVDTQAIASAAFRSRVEHTRKVWQLATEFTSEDETTGLSTVRSSLAKWVSGTKLPQLRTSDQPKEEYPLAYALARRENWLPAMELLDKLTRESPGEFRNWLLKALCHERVWERSAAIRCYTKCIGLKPKFAWCYLRRGAMYLAMPTDQWELGEDDLAKVLKMQPELGAAYVLRAGGRRRVGRYKESLADMNRAIELNGDRLDLYLLRWQIRAEAVAKTRMSKERKQAEQELIKQDQERILNSRPRTWKDWLTRGMVRMSHDPKKALADLDTVLTLHPDHQVALFYKAKVLFQQLRQTQKAIDVLTQAIERYPNHLDYRLTRGYLFTFQGDRKLGVEDAEFVLEHDSSPRTLYRVAKIYARAAAFKVRTQEELAFREKALEKAFDLLRSALDKGYGWDEILTETEFRVFRKYPPFQQIRGAALVLSGRIQERIKEQERKQNEKGKTKK